MMSQQPSFLDSLNQPQRAATTAADGPIMIVAGPGTGKTGTLAARIAWLLTAGRALTPDILALTFTTKAAAEMRTRLSQLLGPAAPLPAVLTFHAFCRQLLSQMPTADPRGTDLAFATDAERRAVLSQLSRPPELRGLSSRELALRLSRYHNSLAAVAPDPADATSTPAAPPTTRPIANRPPIIAASPVASPAATPPEPAAPANLSPNRPPADPLAQLAQVYAQALAATDRRDFDDLLVTVYRHLVAGRLTAPAYRYVLVDEFQDTSELQYALARRLQPAGGLFVIGDPHQSIYAFRGAGAGFFDRFAADFPDHTAITLTTNYRSTHQLVALGNAIFPSTHPLTAHTTAPGRLRLLHTLNEYSEADWIVGEIEAGLGGTDLLRADPGRPQATSIRDYAVVYRTHRSSQPLRRRLEASGIPYQVAGVGSPYERPELQCLIAVLRVLAIDPPGQPPATNAGSPTTPGPLASLAGHAPLADLTPRQLQALLAEWHALAIAEPVSTLTALIAARLGLTADPATRRDVAQLTGLLSCHDADPFGLVTALNHLDDLAQSGFYDPDADTVALLTIHAAKGLEFAHVFVCGVEEGLLPHGRSSEPDDLAEEQRLFYVAVTRARRRLDLTYTKERARGTTTLSRFVRDLNLPDLERLTDPAMAALERKRSRRRWERAQGSLF